MKLYTFAADGDARIGAETREGLVCDLQAAHTLATGEPHALLRNMQSLIEGGVQACELAASLVARGLEESLRPIGQLKLLAPLPRPIKIRAFSTFERHLVQATDGAARTMASKSPDPEQAYDEMRKRFNLDSLPGPGWRETPAYFYSDVTAVTSHDIVVDWPSYSSWIDFELELAAVIGVSGKDIAAEDAYEHVFGYTIFNDLSARDAQFQAMSTGLGFAKGKDFDNSNPMGPCIVTKDDVPDPHDLQMKVRVNGEQWSSSQSGEARWRLPDCIAYASQAQTLLPGEIFLTGCAPDGCSLELMREVRKGDVIELEIERIGVLRTTIR
jgi:2-keto-4-pentenoate hydratase/2-oxohepta-3-ene-1,7-dioic acid hydratase in catechol pathway